jgi:heptosyltransferase III
VAAGPFQRALVIRGGALGDFLLTLPVLAALRDAAPEARLEMLAYPGIAKLARAGRLIDEARSIEYGPLAGFFTQGSVLDPALRDYFASFDVVVSYLYDPDGIFADNLRAAGVGRLIQGPARPADTAHAIDQLAGPLTELGLALPTRATRLDFGADKGAPPTVALHPGSGSAAKNWPVDHWRLLAERLLAEYPDLHIAVVGGEADGAALEAMRGLTPDERVASWHNLPLNQLAARLASCRAYLGHDTGVSHLAAVAGVPSLLLFGPTDPGVWAPPHDQVRLLRAPEGQMENLEFQTVRTATRALLTATGLARGAAGTEA